jgi:L-lactate utilization protein LutC
MRQAENGIFLDIIENKTFENRLKRELIMATKKRQYHMWEYNQDDLYEKDRKSMLDISIDDAVTTSETLMHYILNEKIREKEYDVFR